MTGFIELSVMVFAFCISFAVFLIHKAIREKEAGLMILALVLAAASVFLTVTIILNVSNADSVIVPEGVIEQLQDLVTE